ncbi:hypothetical protein [Rhodococcoides corynebacterioides]|uniref:RDD family protein n=1 Tax=Rhodococcoides corynebacterioides TaxID=53972 RepID=A0ABS7P1B1_9NOCA|nr:hypothetical protein [Rhodococcus corynebacterioides]MBY6366190.1 hypothetical protein [Rhodococcus corynebacterioides]MBY6408933.1 hypothetical protein [Rhodococcus corynebacterioides]
MTPPPRVPPQPVFLEPGLGYAVRTWTGDLLQFVLGLVYYVAVLALGGPAVLVDRVLGTRCYDHLVRLAERLDHGASS